MAKWRVLRSWKWSAGGALLLLLTAMTFHVEKASRFEPAALTPAPAHLVLDSRDRILRLGENPQGQRVILLPDDPLPPLVVAAFVAAEDARFRKHFGLDPAAVARALWANLRAGRVVSGASTITQQLARLAYPAPRTYYHKLVEMLRSFRIEAALSKDDILRAYLNSMPQGNNLVGVETAARLYFGKTSARLSPGEAAVLAALAKAPGTLNPRGPQRQRLQKRRDWVLQRLTALGYLSPQEGQAARQTDLKAFSGNLFPFEAPHFVNLVLAAPEPTGVRRTTLDLTLQRRAQAIVLSHRTRLQKVGVTQAAVVILHNRSLGVAALVGSFQYGPRDQGYNNGAAARRSPGSTLKPFLYAQALDAGLNPAMMLEDVDGRYRTPRGEFTPANFDRVAHGPVSMREALGNSLNLSAVSLLQQIGPPAFYNLLTRLQLINRPERTPEHYGLGLVVGNPEVSLLQLAAAYAALANGGVFQPARLLKAPYPAGQEISSSPPPNPLSSREEGNPAATSAELEAPPALDRPEAIFSPQAAYIISDILADPLARARTFGGSQAMNPPFPLAIKTGTSTRYRDCWAVGYTREYTIAVWTGNFDGRPTAKMSGAAVAAPILADLAGILLPPDHSAGFPPPDDLTRLEVCSFSGMPPGPDCRHRRQEFFIAGTEPQTPCTYHHSRQPWHQIPTRFAGWLHNRYAHQGAGRFRLAGFDHDLQRTFGESESGKGEYQEQPGPDQAFDPLPDPLPSGGRQGTVPRPQASEPDNGSFSGKSQRGRTGKKLSLGENQTIRLHTTLFPALAARQAPRITIASPLPGDRFLLPSGQTTLALTLKAACRVPFPQVSWFLDGQEYAATGPPYELSLQVARGRHRFTVIGPDGLGDTVEVVVE